MGGASGWWGIGGSDGRCRTTHWSACAASIIAGAWSQSHWDYEGL